MIIHVGLAKIDEGQTHDPSHVYDREKAERHPLVGQDHHFHRCTTEGCTWTLWSYHGGRFDIDGHHEAELVELP